MFRWLAHMTCGDLEQVAFVASAPESDSIVLTWTGAICYPRDDCVESQASTWVSFRLQKK